MLLLIVTFVRPFVVDFVSFRGMDWFVCLFVFISSARSFSHCLSVLSHCLCLSQFLFSPFLLALISTSIWLLLPESIIFIMFFVCFLLPLICNNSCILRDATVCVFVVCTVQKREVCPIFPACRLRVCVGVWFFLLAIAQLVLLVVGVAELFFLLLISCSFFCFLLCVGVIRGMFQ